MDLTPGTTSSEWTEQLCDIDQESCISKQKPSNRISSQEARDRAWARRWRTRLYHQRVQYVTETPEQLPTPIQDDFGEDPRSRIIDVTSLEDNRGLIRTHETSLITPETDPEFSGQSRRGRVAEDSMTLARWTSRQARSLSPVTVLQKGNSDPFNSFSVQVTASVTSLIAFGRDVLHPALYVSARQYNPEAVSQTLRQLWQDVSNHLQDKAAAYAYLARSAVLIRSLDPNTSPGQELVFKHLSAKLLRERLAKLDTNGLHSFQTYFVIYALFQVDLFDRNFESAAVHMKMLSTLITEHELGDYEPLPLHFIYRPLYTDASLAAMALTRPHFDPEGPVWKRFVAVKTEVINSLPEIPPVSLIDDSVNDKTVRSIFLDIRTFTAVRSLMLSDPSKAKSSSWLYIFSETSLLTNRLLTFYNDSLRDCAILENLEVRRPRDYEHQYLALGAVLWLRQLVGIESQLLGGKGRIFVAYPTLLAGMREALIKSNQQSTGSAVAISDRARLWALYIGAACEEDRSKVSDEAGAKKGWFQEQFPLQAEVMWIRTWQNVRKTLQRFLYTDELKPHGSEWVWKILCNN